MKADNEGIIPGLTPDPGGMEYAVHYAPHQTPTGRELSIHFDFHAGTTMASHKDLLCRFNAQSDQSKKHPCTDMDPEMKAFAASALLALAQSRSPVLPAWVRHSARGIYPHLSGGDATPVLALTPDLRLVGGTQAPGAR
jgi:hypothetical protein